MGKNRKKTGRKIKNSWRFTHGFLNNHGETVLRFINETTFARFDRKVVIIPKKGPVKFEYQIDGQVSGWKNFSRPRTMNVLNKYRPFKKLITN